MIPRATGDPPSSSATTRWGHRRATRRPRTSKLVRLPAMNRGDPGGYGIA